MANIQCKIEIPNISGLKDNELTVGREFILVCEGEFPKNLHQDKLNFTLLPEQKYALKLLGFEFRSSTQADLKVTSYTPGQVNLQDVQLADGEQTVALGNVNFKVESVIPPQQPQQSGEQAPKVEPYGPIGPMSISIPMIYWALLAGVLGILVATIAYKIFRVVQRRNMVERLKEHDSALSPLAQFHQSFRRMQRENTVFLGTRVHSEDILKCMDELHQMLCLFITRSYKIPAFEWSPNLVLKSLKKYHGKVFQEHGDDLKKLLNEYSHAQKDREKISSSDVLNLSKRTRLLVEEMERLS